MPATANLARSKKLQEISGAAGCDKLAGHAGWTDRVIGREEVAKRQHCQAPDPIATVMIWRASDLALAQEEGVTNAQVTIDEASEFPVVSVVGEIDAATVPLLIERLDQIPDTTSKVVIDLSETTFIDSSGLSALVACRKRLDVPNTVIQLVVSRPSIANLFAITGLLDTFPIVSTIEEAMAKS